MYPRNSDPLPPEIPPLVRRTYDSALSCFETGNYEPSVIMSRKTLEGLCRVLGEDDGTLEKRLRHLRDAGTIEPKLYDWANQLRLVGNDAAHDLDLVFSSEDARDCLEFLKAILLYVFALNERFQQFRNRRKKSAAASTA